MEIAVKSVPKRYRSQTPVNLKATAGLRLLGAKEADDILEAVKKYLRQYPFYYDEEDAVEIMDGLDEGLFSWVTVNYLLRTLSYPARQTAVTLDLGGGSTQIAMSVEGQSDTTLLESDVMGSTHSMYLYSHLGYGLMAGRAGVLAFNVDEGDARLKAEEELESECIAPGTKTTYEYGSIKFSLHGKGTSAVSCRRLATQFIQDPKGSFGQAQGAPSPVRGQPVFAMSYYLDRAVGVGIIPPNEMVGRIKPFQYEEAASKICSMTVSEIATKYPMVKSEDAPFLCLDLCFIQALLMDGFKLDPVSEVTLAKKLPFNGEDVETQWALGAGIAELSETREQLGL